MENALGVENGVVVDVQGFVDSRERFVPKEIAVAALNNSMQAHWLISPCCKFSELPLRTKITNEWLTRNHHGLEWGGGDLTREQSDKALREIVRPYEKIYVRGSQKAWYLGKTLLREIVNLEYITPGFKELLSNEDRCAYHSYPRKTKFSCATAHVLTLKTYIIENKDCTLERIDDTGLYVTGLLVDEHESAVEGAT